MLKCSVEKLKLLIGVFVTVFFLFQEGDGLINCFFLPTPYFFKFCKFLDYLQVANWLVAQPEILQCLRHQGRH